MTREVAIKAIQDFIGWFKEDSLIRKALEMAIKALSQEPCEVSEYDKDHIWYKGGQYISLRRFLEVKAEAEKKPCEKCEVGNPCLYCKHEFEPQESDEISERNMKMWEEIFKAESEDKK